MTPATPRVDQKATGPDRSRWASTVRRRLGWSGGMGWLGRIGERDRRFGCRI
jgi:hypothetical protein